MLCLKHEKHGITFFDCWYAKEPWHKKGIIRYYEAEKPFGKKIKTFETLISSIVGTEEEVVAHFSKNCKYKVNRAPREGVTVQFLEKEQIQDSDIAHFVEYYSAFIDSKGYETVDQKHLTEELKKYRDAAALSIHKASVKGEVIVYHTHILSDDYARLFHSASLYRISEEIPTTVVGMANRYLHKEDMMKFQSMGITKYDWGGAGTGDDVANITEFKESFGGEHMTLYHGEEANGMKEKLYYRLIKLLEKV